MLEIVQKAYICLINVAAIFVLVQCPVLLGKPWPLLDEKQLHNQQSPIDSGCSIVAEENGRLFVCTNISSTEGVILPPDITGADIRDSRLGSFTPESFDASWRFIEKLTITRSSIENIHRYAFSTMRSLESLAFSNSKITAPFDLCIFTALSHLKMLTIDFGLLKAEISGGQSVLTPCQCQMSFATCTECGLIAGCADKTLPTPFCKFCPSTLSNLLSVSLRHAPLPVLSKNMFSSLEDSSITKLELSHNNLTWIDRHAFRPLKNLDHIEISYNPETNWVQLAEALQEAGWKSSSTGREIRTKVVLSSNELTDVPREVLEPISEDLYELVLSHNNFANIRGGSFPSLPNLEKLDLEFCGIQSIAPGAFLGLQELEVLTLKGNNLLEIPADSFPPTLTQLILAINPLSGLQNANPLLGKVEELAVAPHAFAKLKNLLRLSFSGSRVSEVKKTHFTGLQNLQMLELDGCSLHKIEAGSFTELSSLTKLDISSNLLQIDNLGTFDGLTALERLHLANNRINFPKGSPSPFPPLTKLLLLDLSQNDISFVDATLFSSMKSLSYLDLTHNFIQSWKSQVFENVLPTFVLKMADNHLTEVNEAMLDDIRHMNGTDFSKNPFACSCDLKGFTEYATSPNSSVRESWFSSDYTCIKNDQEVQLQAYDFKTCSNRQPLLVYTAIGVCVSVVFLLAIVSYKNRWQVKVFMIRFQVWWRTRNSTTQEGTYDFDAFVSYSEGDRGWIFDFFVPKIEEELKFRLCLHERDFKVGRDINDNIVAAIQKSRKLVLVVSKSFVASKWCQFEVKFAHKQILYDKHRDVILVLLESVSTLKESSSLPETLKYFLRTRTYVEWPEDEEKTELFWTRLQDSLTSRSG